MLILNWIVEQFSPPRLSGQGLPMSIHIAVNTSGIFEILPGFGLRR